MWGQYLVKTERDLFDSLMKEVFYPKFNNAFELLAKGDSESFGIHQYRYAARQALLLLLTDLLDWRKDNQKHLNSLSEQVTKEKDSVITSFVLPLAVCKTLMMIGVASFDAMESVEGYRYVLAAMKLLEGMQATGVPPSSDDLSLITELQVKAHTAPIPSVMFTKAHVEKKHVVRKSFVGTALLLEAYIFITVAWSKWGDNDLADTCLSAHELLITDIRAAKEIEWAKKKEETISSLKRAQNEADELKEKHRMQQQEEQRLALEERLRNRKKKGAGGTPKEAQSDSDASTPAVQVSSPSATQSETQTETEREKIHKQGPSWSFPGLRWAKQEQLAGNAVQFMHRCGLESTQTIDEMAGMALSCKAQVSKSQNSVVQSSYYCHRSLAQQLQTSGTNMKDWVTACLSLAEWYIIVTDLSHAEHCLKAVDEIVKRSGGSIKLDDPVQFVFLKATLDYNLLKLSQKALEDVQSSNSDSNTASVITPLFLNRLHPPEEFRNAPLSKVPETPDWGFSERLPLPLSGLAPPRKEMLVTAQLSGVQEMIGLYQHMDECLTSIKDSITVDLDCEKWLESVRMQADALSILFDISGDTQCLEQRLAVLQSIHTASLNKNAFRNVLRQADYDAGSSALTIFENLEKTDEKRAMFLESAALHFSNFVNGFEGELAEARKQNQESDAVFDSSDYPAFVIGQMRLGHIYLKQVKTNSAKQTFEKVVAFIHKNPKCQEEYDDIRVQLKLAEEVLELLGSKEGQEHRPIEVAPSKKPPANRVHALPVSRLQAKKTAKK